MKEKNSHLSSPSSGLNRFELIDKEDFNQLKLRYLELTSLFEINKILNSTLDLRAILDNVLLTPMGRLMISRGMVLIEEQQDILTVRNVKGLSPELIGRKFTLPRRPEHIELLDKNHNDRSSLFYKLLRDHQLEIVIPLISNQKYLGILAYGRKFGGEPFTQADLEFLESIANLAGIAIEKGLLFAEIQESNKKLDRKIQQLNTLFEIGRELNSTLDQSQITQILSFAIMGELLLNKCVILIDTQNRLKLEVSKGVDSALEQLDFQKCRGPLMELFAAKRSYIALEEETFTGEMKEICDLLKKNDISYLVPMISKDHVKGIIGIGKKINGEDLSEGELEFLEALGNEAVIGIENAFLVQEMLEKQRLEDELKIAHDIQNQLLPRKLPDIPGVEIAAINIPSREVGGDYYDCIRLNGERFGIAIADVSGKSTPAALLMANLQASLRALAIDHSDVVETVRHINQIIYQNTAEDKFITFFYAILDAETRILTYTNAGHNPPFLIKQNGQVLKLKEGGLILGMMPEVEYESGEIRLSPGDLLFLYTDGVTETLNREEEEFGEERLQPLLLELHGESPDKILAEVQKKIFAFSAGLDQYDDITMMALKIRSS